MRISPSVIFLNSYIHDSISTYITYEIIHKLTPIDSKIMERAIILLLDLSFQDEERKPYCQTVIRTIYDKNFRIVEFQVDLSLTF